MRLSVRPPPALTYIFSIAVSYVYDDINLFSSNLLSFTTKILSFLIIVVCIYIMLRDVVFICALVTVNWKQSFLYI